MKTTLIASILMFSCAIYSQENTPKKSKKEKTTVVYICNSLASKTYHKKKECSRLKLCKDTIVAINLHKAKNYGRVICKYEFYK